MKLCVALLAFGVGTLSVQHVGLRERIAEAQQDGITASELALLAEVGFEDARSAKSRSQLWNALTQIAKLCELAPRRPTRAIRRQALELLAEHDSDTLRWSSLVASAFIPPLERLEPHERDAELEAYDRLLVDVANQSRKERVRAELSWARIRVRLFIDRHRAWLTPEQREQTLAWASRLEREHGAAPVPGDALGTTQRDRARAARDELTHLAFGAIAPATAGSDLNGEPLAVSDFRGRIVVLDFWTTFCQPCLALVPEANRILAELAGQPLVYVGVNGDPRRDEAAATATRTGMAWRSLWDENGTVARTWRVAEVGWPSVFVLDRAGRIRAKLRGRESIERELEGLLRDLLAEDR